MASRPPRPCQPSIRGRCSTCSSPSRLLDRGDYAVGVAVAVRGRSCTPPTSATGSRRPRRSPSTPAPSLPSRDRCRRGRRRPVRRPRPNRPRPRRRRPRPGRPSTARRDGDRARGPLPHRQHQQGDHGDRRAAARGGRPARHRRRRRRAPGSARRRRRRPIPEWQAITVRQLLSHTAGFPSYQRAFFGGRYRIVPGARRATACQPVAERRPGHRLHVLQPQLLPARPARRADRRASLRGGGHRPPAGAARHRRACGWRRRPTPTRRR